MKPHFSYREVGFCVFGKQMRDFSQIYNLPNFPAVYAFYSGGRAPQHVTYVELLGNSSKGLYSILSDVIAASQPELQQLL